MMLTVPNTLGLFERDVGEISKVVHDAGGLMYYDGANMNALLGKAQPGGHGVRHRPPEPPQDLRDPARRGRSGRRTGRGRGGAPGLPAGPGRRPRAGRTYHLDYGRPEQHREAEGVLRQLRDTPEGVLLHQAAGRDGLDNVSSLSVLGANYLLSKLDPEAYAILQGKGLRRKHEAVVSVKGTMSGGAMKVAKALLDYGVHSPTVYFPLTVEEALMIEPTETETLEALDEYAELLNALYEKLERGELEDEPQNTSVGRIDEVKASHPLTLKVKW